MMHDYFLGSLTRIFKFVLTLFFCITALFLFHIGSPFKGYEMLNQRTIGKQTSTKNDLWQAPDIQSIPGDAQGKLIRYGYQLIAHTSTYLGPQGIVNSISNGMNCQNCHLQAGTKIYGNNYARVASSYPKFRTRSGTVEGFEKRINDCIERSLNGKPLDTKSREMEAIIAYMKWVGKGLKKGDPPKGTGFIKLRYLNRQANPVKGRTAYNIHCSQCHGKNGEGQMFPDRMEWQYPPVWGDQSYNTGAGFYRIIKLATFIKTNMPYGTPYDDPVLSNEEAWDIAAYINSMPRPEKDFSLDWPDISQKPVDHPFGPYADNFSEEHHKYGPYQPIIGSNFKK